MLIQPDNVNMRYNFACTLSLYLKDAEGALGLLEAVFARDRPDLVASASTDPDLDPIRDDPRFLALLLRQRRGSATGEPRTSRQIAHASSELPPSLPRAGNAGLNPADAERAGCHSRGFGRASALIFNYSNEAFCPVRAFHQLGLREARHGS